jgi:PKD repeat protein
VKLKADAGLVGKKLALGGTKIKISASDNASDVKYPATAPAATFTVVGPCPTVEFAMKCPSHPQTVSRGQTFLAARVSIDSLTPGVSQELTLTQVTLQNIATDKPLPGAFVSKIQVIDEIEGLLGETTAAKDLATDAGTVISITKTYRVGNYSRKELDILVTLSTSAPYEYKLELKGKIRLTGSGFAPMFFEIETACPFVVGEVKALIDVSPVYIESKGVVPGETFLAQKIRLRDDDDDNNDVVIGSIYVKNIENTAPLADQHVAKIEVKRSSDGALMGSTTNVSGLNSSTGALILFSANNILRDDTEMEIEIWVTLKTTAPATRKILLSSQLAYSEGGNLPEDRPFVPSTATFTVVIAGGFEVVSSTTASASLNVYPGQTFLAQEIKLTDSDDDPYNVTITKVIVRNISTATALIGDIHVVEIEVRDKESGAILGTITTISGLTSSTGVTIPMTANNRVPDDKSITIQIWITLKSDAPSGRKLKLGTKVEHTEGGQTFTKPADFLPCAAEFTIQTTDAARLSVSFSYTPTSPKWSDEITFTPSVTPSAGVVYARWDFGDGTIVELDKGEGQNPLGSVKHKYGKGGDFKVVLTVRDSYREAQTTKTVTVTNALPTNVDFSWEPSAPKWNTLITFKPSADIKDPDGEIGKATFKWDFGDGNTKTVTGLVNVTHTYNKDGKFTVTLTVTDQGGASSSAKKEITVTNEPPVNVDFSWTPEAPKWSDEITFEPAANVDDPDGDINKATFKWDFGDGVTTTTTGPKEVKHTYGAGKTYTVKLTVTDEGGKAVTQEKDVYVRPMGVDFSWTPKEPKVGETVTFVPDVIDITSPRTFAWDFGDGSVSMEQQPTHKYEKAGTFKVVLIVTDAQNKQWKAEKSITVSAATGPTVTSLTCDPPVPEVGQEITFTATVSKPAYDPVTAWEWDFNGDGTVDNTSASPVRYTYTESGAYTVKVRVRTQYGGWSSWKTLELYVRPQGGAMIGTKVLDNPASNQCRIQIFAPADAQDLKITIFDQAGRPVLLDKPVSIGTFTWDLKDRDGRVVPNGLYLFYVTGKIGDKIERSEIGRILVRR